MQALASQAQAVAQQAEILAMQAAALLRQAESLLADAPSEARSSGTERNLGNPDVNATAEQVFYNRKAAGSAPAGSQPT